MPPKQCWAGQCFWGLRQIADKDEKAEECKGNNGLCFNEPQLVQEEELAARNCWRTKAGDDPCPHPPCEGVTGLLSNPRAGGPNVFSIFTRGLSSEEEDATRMMILRFH